MHLFEEKLPCLKLELLSFSPRVVALQVKKLSNFIVQTKSRFCSCRLSKKAWTSAKDLYIWLDFQVPRNGRKPAHSFSSSQLASGDDFFAPTFECYGKRSSNLSEAFDTRGKASVVLNISANAANEGR